MLRLERITRKNLKLAVDVQREIFPEYSAEVNYEESINGTTDYEYDLIYNGDDCIGITGIYSIDTDKESSWLGWFGIREKYRRKHFGTEAIKLYEKAAKERGFKYARLYADRDDNDATLAFYRNNGYVSEPYTNKEDCNDPSVNLLIFSKSLTDAPLVPWGNRNIHLTEQLEKQKID